MKPQVIPSLVPLAPEHFQWARYREDHAQYVLALNSFKAPIEASMARNPGVALLLGQPAQRTLLMAKPAPEADPEPSQSLHCLEALTGAASSRWQWSAGS